MYVHTLYVPYESKSTETKSIIKTTKTTRWGDFIFGLVVS